MNEFAWLFATANPAALRDGAAAIALGEKAVALTKRSDSGLLDTLAAAYAEAGRFKDALAAQEEANRLATDENLKKELDLHATAYRSNTPWREQAPHHLAPPSLEDKRFMAAFFGARGRLIGQFGNSQSAVADLQRAIDLDPQEHDYYHCLAPLLIRTGDFPQKIL